MHRTLLIAAAVAVLLAAPIGCSKFSGSEGTADKVAKSNVAIIDLDSVARQLGYDNQMAVAIKQQNASLQKQLGAIKASLNQELDKVKSQVGENPTPEQEQQLKKSSYVLSAKYTEEHNKAKVMLNRYSAQLIRQFCDAVKTTAREVAAERDLQIILTKNPNVVFDYDMAVDITDEVAKRMRAEHASTMGSQPETQPSSAAPESAPASQPTAEYPRS